MTRDTLRSRAEGAARVGTTGYRQLCPRLTDEDSLNDVYFGDALKPEESSRSSLLTSRLPNAPLEF